ncbi:conserved protein of unknown function [Tenacibaculum sp. 190524A02b]|uniref:Uncharacterized protein n=1 Tax=Tenacibaculum vairaonense TaxID=3137860 RepID=A0ABM9PIC0_9FLAO
MKNTYEQLNIEYTETREVSLQIKIATIFLALIFALIPLAELVYEFDYNHIITYFWYGCGFGAH